MKMIFTILLISIAQDISVASMPKYKMAAPVIVNLDRLTVYNPIESQTDSDPLITASNAKIDIDKLIEGKLRWIAISRDMLKRWGGQIKYGDTVYIKIGDPAIDGYWYVQDTMNKRYKKSADLLFHQSVKKRGRWKNVKLHLIKRH